MEAMEAMPGWYATDDGLRFWDGVQWTDYLQRPLSDAERTERLQAAVAAEVLRGARVESQTAHQAILAYGRPTNHVAHLLGAIFTCGLWLIGWLIAVAIEKPIRRVSFRVDPYGNVIRG